MSGPAPQLPSDVLKDLHLAVCHGDFAQVNRLCTRESADYVDPSSGLSLLAWAIARDHLDIARRLIDLGASAVLRDRNGFAVLHRAVWEASPAAVELLLSHAQVDVNVRSAKHAKTPLILAAMKGDAAKVECLLRHGADLEARGRDGMSAIDHATYLGFAEVVELLVDAGADCCAARYYCEEGVKNVTTLAQRNNFDRIIAFMCKPWAQQSLVTV